jgi:hypothetical protein
MAAIEHPAETPAVTNRANSVSSGEKLGSHHSNSHVLAHVVADNQVIVTMVVFKWLNLVGDWVSKPHWKGKFVMFS